MSKHFAALDAGNHGITVVGARWNKTGDYVLEGFCRTGSKGFSKGIVTDVALATDSITDALKKLREKTGRKVHDVYTGVSSTSVEMSSTSGVLLLSKYGREILQRDIKKCVEIGSTVKMPLDRELLHRIVQGFSLDGEKEIKNPLKLEGVKLGVKVNVLTINSSTLRNMQKCISQSGFVPAGFVFLGLASSYRVLSEDDREMGVALMDICSDLTEIMVFHRGVLTGCRVFPVGTGDIRPEKGAAHPGGMEKLLSRFSSLPGWEKVRKIVVIGEGVLTHDLIEFFEKAFTIPVVAGTCAAKPFEDLPPERTGYIGSLGILDHLQAENRKHRPDGSLVKRAFDRSMEFIDRYF